MRPDRLVALSGTGTDIGKTWVGARLATSLGHEGLTVSARKPVQSFDPDDDHPTDADVLANATGERPHDVCPPHRWYPTPLAPPMAAASLSRPPFTISDLVGELVWPDSIDIGILEGAGGIHSPIADDGDTLNLIEATRPHLVIVVADAQLGTINNIRLTTSALSGQPYLIHLNRYDPTIELHQLNFQWITQRLDAAVTTTIDELAGICSDLPTDLV